MKKFTITKEWQLIGLMVDLKGEIAKGGCTIQIDTVTKPRTVTQNASLHVYLTQVALALADAGFSQRMLVDRITDANRNFDLPVTMEMVKEIFRKVAKDMYGKTSTTQLSTVEIQKVYETVDKGFAMTTGVSFPWPSNEPPAYEGQND